MFKRGIYSKIVFIKTGRYPIIFWEGEVTKRDNAFNYNHCTLLKHVLYDHNGDIFDIK